MNRIRRKDWGRWYVEIAPHAVYVCYQQGATPSVHDFDCNLATATDWAVQVASKRWATPEVMRGLTAALRDCAGSRFFPADIAIDEAA